LKAAVYYKKRLAWPKKHIESNSVKKCVLRPKQAAVSQKGRVLGGKKSEGNSLFQKRRT